MTNIAVANAKASILASHVEEATGYTCACVMADTTNLSAIAWVRYRPNVFSRTLINLGQTAERILTIAICAN
jgi:hypothetical protein